MSATSLVVWDDQGPQLVNAYGGSWQNLNQVADAYNNTLSVASTPGSTLSFSFAGTQVFVTGAVLNGTTFPSATFSIDDASAGTQQPFLDNTTGILYYFQSPQLSAKTHTLFMNVTQASTQGPFILDAVRIAPLSASSSGLPTNTASAGHSTTNVGAIVGGVVGGVVVLALIATAMVFFLRRRSGRAYYFEKENAGNMLDSEIQQSPQETRQQTSSYGVLSQFSPSTHGRSETMYTDDPETPFSLARGSIGMALSSNSSAPSDSGGMSPTSGIQVTQKASLMARTTQNEPDPVVHADSGLRFSLGEEPGPSHIAPEIPPSYTET